MKKIFLIIAGFAMLGCTNLDIYPENTQSSEIVFSTLAGTKEALAKVYGAYTVSGNVGPAGNNDISFPGADEGGNSSFLRVYFNAQEMPTDEAHCLWNDNGIPELNFISFTPSNPFTMGLYYRLCMQIMYANDFIRNANESLGNEVAYMKAEARFLRAFDYWCLMDLYGNPPFFTEQDNTGILPRQIQRADLFEWLEGELKDLADNNKLPAAHQNEYGRADVAAAQALLARMYLNAEVYTGTARWADASDYADRVIKSGYSLMENYEHLFMADNDRGGNNPEFILPIPFDGMRTRSFGSTTFLINCTMGGDYANELIDGNPNPNYSIETFIGTGISVNANWGGYRVRGQFAQKFDAGDKRRMLLGEKAKEGTPEAPFIGADPSKYLNGMATYKYRNITSASVLGDVINGSHNEFADTDYPLFRLAEMYLIYAEAFARDGSGNGTDALEYVNLLRDRGDVTRLTAAQLTPQAVLDERARELYWECHRRTDLIRFGQFGGTSTYTWEWKGGTQGGSDVAAKFNIYPIPASDLISNGNLTQNADY